MAYLSYSLVTKLIVIISFLSVYLFLAHVILVKTSDIADSICPCRFPYFQDTNISERSAGEIRRRKLNEVITNATSIGGCPIPEVRHLLFAILGSSFR